MDTGVITPRGQRSNGEATDCLSERSTLMPKSSKPMTWKEASKKLRELVVSEYAQDWPAEYTEAVLIGIERIEEVEDLQGTEDYA